MINEGSSHKNQRLMQTPYTGAEAVAKLLKNFGVISDAVSRFGLTLNSIHEAAINIEHEFNNLAAQMRMGRSYYSKSGFFSGGSNRSSSNFTPQSDEEYIENQIKRASQRAAVREAFDKDYEDKSAAKYQARMEKRAQEREALENENESKAWERYKKTVKRKQAYYTKVQEKAKEAREKKAEAAKAQNQKTRGTSTSPNLSSYQTASLASDKIYYSLKESALEKHKEAMKAIYEKYAFTPKDKEPREENDWMEKSLKKTAQFYKDKRLIKVKAKLQEMKDSIAIKITTAKLDQKTDEDIRKAFKEKRDIDLPDHNPLKDTSEKIISSKHLDRGDPASKKAAFVTMDLETASPMGHEIGTPKHKENADIIQIALELRDAEGKLLDQVGKLGAFFNTRTGDIDLPNAITGVEGDKFENLKKAWKEEVSKRSKDPKDEQDYIRKIADLIKTVFSKHTDEKTKFVIKNKDYDTGVLAQGKNFKSSTLNSALKPLYAGKDIIDIQEMFQELFKAEAFNNPDAKGGSKTLDKLRAVAENQGDPSFANKTTFTIEQMVEALQNDLKTLSTRLGETSTDFNSLHDATQDVTAESFIYLIGLERLQEEQEKIKKANASFEEAINKSAPEKKKPREDSNKSSSNSGLDSALEFLKTVFSKALKVEVIGKFPLPVIIKNGLADLSVPIEPINPSPENRNPRTPESPKGAPAAVNPSPTPTSKPSPTPSSKPNTTPSPVSTTPSTPVSTATSKTAPNPVSKPEPASNSTPISSSASSPDQKSFNPFPDAPRNANKDKSNTEDEDPVHTWAVRKTGVKNSKRNFTSQEKAEEYIRSYPHLWGDPGVHIEARHASGDIKKHFLNRPEEEGILFGNSKKNNFSTKNPKDENVIFGNNRKNRNFRTLGPIDPLTKDKASNPSKTLETNMVLFNKHLKLMTLETIKLRKSFGLTPFKALSTITSGSLVPKQADLGTGLSPYVASQPAGGGAGKGPPDVPIDAEWYPKIPDQKQKKEYNFKSDKEGPLTLWEAISQSYDRLTGKAYENNYNPHEAFDAKVNWGEEKLDKWAEYLDEVLNRNFNRMETLQDIIKIVVTNGTPQPGSFSGAGSSGGSSGSTPSGSPSGGPGGRPGSGPGGSSGGGSTAGSTAGSSTASSGGSSGKSSSSSSGGPSDKSKSSEKENPESSEYFETEEDKASGSYPLSPELSPEEILGFEKGYKPTEKELKDASRNAYKKYAKDRGGSDYNMKRVNSAIDILKNPGITKEDDKQKWESVQESAKNDYQSELEAFRKEKQETEKRKKAEAEAAKKAKEDAAAEAAKKAAEEPKPEEPKAEESKPEETPKEDYKKELEIKAPENSKAEEEAKAQEEARIKAEEEKKAKAEQEARAREEQEARAREEQEAKAKAEQEAKAKAEQEAKAKAEQEAKAKAEQEAKAKAEQEAKTKAEQEAKAKAEQTSKSRTTTKPPELHLKHPMHPSLEPEEVLGFKKGYKPTNQEAKSAFRKKAMQHHPDRGGTNYNASRVNEAWETMQEKDPLTKRQKWSKVKSAARSGYQPALDAFREEYPQEYSEPDLVNKKEEQERMAREAAARKKAAEERAAKAKAAAEAKAKAEEERIAKAKAEQEAKIKEEEEARIRATQEAAAKAQAEKAAQEPKKTSASSKKPSFFSGISDRIKNTIKGFFGKSSSTDETSYMSEGGEISEPLNGDTVPAQTPSGKKYMLMPGEFVSTKKASQKYSKFLKAINRGEDPFKKATGLAKGGMIVSGGGGSGGGGSGGGGGSSGGGSPYPISNYSPKPPPIPKSSYTATYMKAPPPLPTSMFSVFVPLANMFKNLFRSKGKPPEFDKRVGGPKGDVFGPLKQWVDNFVENTRVGFIAKSFIALGNAVRDTVSGISSFVKAASPDSFSTLSGSIQLLVASVGSRFIPIILRVSQLIQTWAMQIQTGEGVLGSFVNTLANFVNNMPQWLLELLGKIALFGAGMGVLAPVFAALSSALGIVSGVISLFGSAIKMIYPILAPIFSWLGGILKWLGTQAFSAGSSVLKYLGGGATTWGAIGKLASNFMLLSGVILPLIGLYRMLANEMAKSKNKSDTKGIAQSQEEQALETVVIEGEKEQEKAEEIAKSGGKTKEDQLAALKEEDEKLRDQIIAKNKEAHKQALGTGKNANVEVRPITETYAHKEAQQLERERDAIAQQKEIIQGKRKGFVKNVDEAGDRAVEKLGGMKNVDRNYLEQSKLEKKERGRGAAAIRAVDEDSGLAGSAGVKDDSIDIQTYNRQSPIVNFGPKRINLQTGEQSNVDPKFKVGDKTPGPNSPEGKWEGVQYKPLQEALNKLRISAEKYKKDPSKKNIEEHEQAEKDFEAERIRVAPGNTGFNTGLGADYNQKILDDLKKGITQKERERRNNAKNPVIKADGSIAPSSPGGILALLGLSYGGAKKTGDAKVDKENQEREEKKQGLIASFSSMKSQSSFSSVEEAYKKIQVSALGDDPMTIELKKIQEQSLMKMLVELQKLNNAVPAAGREAANAGNLK